MPGNMYNQSPQPPRRDPDTQMASEPTLSSLAALAETSAAVDDEGFSADPSSSRGAPKTKEQLRRHYIRALHKVIDESDIVILVLDARDPEGCRSRLVEEEVRRRESEGKKLVFVLNKIVQLERGLKVIDSPGVVFDDDDFDDGKGSKKKNILLRNVDQIAPGAETVGQAQIVAELAKPFSLDRLFGAADAGAFGFEPPADVEMGDEETEDFPEEMDEDGQTTSPRTSRANARAPPPSPPPRAPPPRRARGPRRSHDVPAYDAPVEEHARRAMASANPLGRRVLKREAKKARRAATRALGRPLGGGMDVDDLGLGATFMDAEP
ncbi:uncharacterized protein TRAVEDRAFT_75218 [Trametes versicolor FP-101664 SS1]|uniref:uncharacterized protein n=1 Tax=Trametes versicolor (strain FP-101664) TaxID=717944 RepID=UPI0004624838|nr:uncharacterized protein TRAVEDRAFT_75218 [Trametes versicolor FP-101664 SS1]EIW53047.1 hypothetical protein TRAVEDRAFT_75218 [Trametes versicolor FP-101664 SS1]